MSKDVNNHHLLVSVEVIITCLLMLINLVIKAPLVKGEGIRGWGDNIIGEILSGTDISCDRVETISAN